MRQSVAIFSPDSHLIYDRSILDQRGIGGGATVRVRIAHALARLGYQVSLYINCPSQNRDMGVDLHHFSDAKNIEADIFVAGSTGGNLDLSAVNEINIRSALKILLVGGWDFPRGISPTQFDFIYCPSNFIRNVAIQKWGVTGKKIFVSHHGVETAFYKHPFGLSPRRDPYALVYSGHPSKGYDSARALIKELKIKNARFNLHYFGGNALWGENKEMTEDSLVTQHGLVGQKTLARHLQKCSFSIHLQLREEPFGISLIESMAAGCIVLASPVGAFPEIITPGENGFLIPGDPGKSETIFTTAKLISELFGKQDFMKSIRKNSLLTPLSWMQVAHTWREHWNWYFGKTIRNTTINPGNCPDCGHENLNLTDGHHCTHCGHYERNKITQI